MEGNSNTSPNLRQYLRVDAFIGHGHLLQLDKEYALLFDHLGWRQGHKTFFTTTRKVEGLVILFLDERVRERHGIIVQEKHVFHFYTRAAHDAKHRMMTRIITPDSHQHVE
jgi:hypothetical protein